MNRLNLLRNALSGRYTIEREAGSGGMATVYVATNLRSNAVTPSDEVVYVQGSGRTTTNFIRGVPRWTDQVRAAVAAAER